MKVAFIYEDIHIGGIQKLIFEICKRLIKQGNKVVLITQNGGEEGEEYNFRRIGTKFYRLGNSTKSKIRIFNAIPWMIKLLRTIYILQNEDIKIVHFMTPPTLTFHYYLKLLLLKVLGFKVITNIGGTTTEYLNDKAKKLVGKYSDAIIAVSTYNKNIFDRFSKKIFVIFLGHDFEVQRQVHKKNDIVLAVGRVDRRKNYETLINTVNELKKEGEKAKFHVVGPVIEANYMKKLRGLIRKNNLEENVVFLGCVSEEILNELYKQSKIFYLPTKHEMFGIVFAEAMSQGLPIVSSNITAIPEVVGDAGILLDPWDYRGHAKAIAHLLSDKTLYESLSQRAVERAKKFTWDNTYKQFIKIWRELSEMEGKHHDAKEAPRKN